MQRLRNLRIGGDDRGIAMVLVIGIASVLLILVVGGVSFAISGQKFARSTQSTDGALAAAYAGIEEFQSRIASDPGYWRYGNTASNFSNKPGAATVAPPVANPAFGVGINGAWARVPDSSNGSGASTSPATYRYEVDNSDYAGSGIIRLRSTGRVGEATRTIVADLKQDGFLDFLYFTDYEIQDPLLAGSTSTCTPAYGWAVPSRPDCSTIQFAGADKLDGPVHSNDTLQICGATLSGAVTSSQPTAPHYAVPSGCSQPSFAVPTKYKPVIGMPTTNSELIKETRSDLSLAVPEPGCLYTGPTSIAFNSNGTMTVKSPWTKYTNIEGQPATSGTKPTACGTPGSSGLASPNGQTIPVPTNNVVYVQNVPATTSDPNYSNDSLTGTGSTCNNTSGMRVSDNNLGYPITNETVPSTSSSNPSYGCRNGDVFVKGTVSGLLTVGSENYVYVTGDIHYRDHQKDMLGLVGQNAVYVWSPIYRDVSCNRSYCYYNGSDDNLKGPSNLNIDAALLSVAHTFTVQNFNLAPRRGVLTINGAIVQRFRGPVATGNGNSASTGYDKNYLYDVRFRYTAPPKFLSPVTTVYSVTVSVETNIAFDATGAAR